MGMLVSPEEAKQFPENEIYGVEVHYDVPAPRITSDLYKADNITDLLYTLASVAGIDNAVDINITTKPEEW